MQLLSASVSTICVVSFTSVCFNWCLQPRPARWPRTSRKATDFSRADWPRLEPPRSLGDGSGEVVSKILEVGVRMLLRSYDNVQVRVSSKLGELVRGRVNDVHLSGRSWCTKLNLRARSLTVMASPASLDYGELLRGSVALTQPAKGWAEAVFDGRDFGYFLCYQALASATPVVAGSKFRFSSEGVIIDSDGRNIAFRGWHANEPVLGSLTLTEEQGRPMVRVCVSQPQTAGPLEVALTVFFRDLQVDLAGVHLRFDQLGFGSLAGEDVAHILLRAEICRIPNPLRDRI